MAFYYTCFLTVASVSTFLIVSTDARSWDIAVSIGHEIDLFTKNGMLIRRSEVANTKMLTGLAYDDATRMMYTSDKENEKLSMCGNNLFAEKSNAYTMLKQKNGAQIMAIAFDPVSRILFWTDSRHHAIMAMHVPLKGNPSPPELLHVLDENYNPYGIALDICNRFVYWSNCKEPTVCSIERSKLDGSDREVIVNGNLYDVYGLAIDHLAGKLYWVNDLEGIAYNIERSNLNGTDRAFFVKGTHHEPVHIAVDNEAVYWTDRQSEAIWKMKKNNGIEDRPVEFRSYHTSHPNSHIMSIITRDNIENLDCDALLNEQGNRHHNHTTPRRLRKSFVKCTYNSDGYWMPLASLHVD